MNQESIQNRSKKPPPSLVKYNLIQFNLVKDDGSEVIIHRSLSREEVG